MIHIRPAQMKDLDPLVEMATLSSGGITSFPADHRLLSQRIEESVFAFTKDVTRPKDESYLFVLEGEGKCIGCSGIRAQLGEPEAVWALHLNHQRQTSSYLPIDKKIKTLTPTEISSGPSEVCTLFLHPSSRKGGLGRLLSLSRFLFMGAFPARFGREVVALIRGYQTEGISPFWENVMRPFFDMPFDEADTLRYRDGRFIADLVPKHPLYVPLLSSKARAIIGKAHPNTEPALKLLKGENFHFSRYVDLFDAGPYFSAPLADIRTLRIRAKRPVSKITETALHSPYHLVANDQLDFRACYAHIHFEEGGVILDRETANTLKVDVGESICYAHPYEEGVNAF